VLDAARARFGVPVLPAMGNHDARGPFRQGLLGEVASDEPYTTSAGSAAYASSCSTPPYPAQRTASRIVRSSSGCARS
jgi:hypothetical protein